jgi:hypothetical protein
MRSRLTKTWSHLTRSRGWRIELVPFGKPSKPPIRQAIPIKWAGLVAAIAAFAGPVQLIRTDDPRYLILFVCGFVVAILTSHLWDRARKQNWIYVEALCIDREVQHREYTDPSGDGHGWEFRVICRFKLDKQEYTVTPYYGSNFWMKRRIETFLSHAIEPDGACVLRVNPENPLEADFIGKPPSEFA